MKKGLTQLTPPFQLLEQHYNRVMEAIDKARERGYENITAQANDLVPKDGGHLYSKVSRRTGNESVLALKLSSLVSHILGCFSQHIQ